MQQLAQRHAHRVPGLTEGEKRPGCELGEAVSGGAGGRQIERARVLDGLQTRARPRDGVHDELAHEDALRGVAAGRGEQVGGGPGIGAFLLSREERGGEDRLGAQIRGPQRQVAHGRDIQPRGQRALTHGADVTQDPDGLTGELLHRHTRRKVDRVGGDGVQAHLDGAAIPCDLHQPGRGGENS